jgi:hypothetical protein
MSFLILVLPFDKEVFKYKWEPDKDGLEARLTLINFEPDFFELSVPCVIFSNYNDWIFEAKGGKGLQISVFEGSLKVLLGSKVSDDIYSYNFNLIEFEKCEFVYFTFRKNSRDLSIKQDQILMQSISIDEEARFELASYVAWNPNVMSSNVEINVTTSSNLFLSKSILREVLDKIIILILIAWVYLNFTNYLKKQTGIKYKVGLNKFDYLSLIYLTFLIFGLNAMIDDGIYLIEAQVMRQSGVLTQYQYPVPFPVGDWHFWITSLFLNDNPNIAVLRIIPAVASFLIWRVFYTKWLSNLSSNQNINYLNMLTWSVWALFCTAFLLSLRPEVYVSLILLVGLTIIKDYFYEGKLKTFYLSIPLILLALSLHQTGVVVLFMMIPVWFHFLFINRLKGLSLIHLSFNFLIGIYILFINSNFMTLIAKVRDFESVSNSPFQFEEKINWSDPPWAEWNRIKHIFLADPLRFTAGMITIGTLILLVVFFAKMRNNLSNNEKFFLASILIGSAGLVFAPSKWVDHYGALLPFVMISCVYFFRNKNKVYLLILLFYMSALSIFTLNKSWVVGSKNIFTLDLNNTVIETVYFLASDKSFLMGISIFFGLLLTLLLIINVLKTKLNLLSIFSLILLAVLVIRQISPPVIDSLIGTEGWSFNRQVAATTTNSEYRCGIFSEKLLANLNVDPKSKFAFAAPQDYLIYPCLRPTPIEAGIWSFPDYSVGNVFRWDQQRLMNRISAQNIFCFNSSPRISSDNFEQCIYKLQSEIPQMRLFDR